MSDSEVFENYLKITLENSMSKQASKKVAKTERSDASTIEALYGVKPDSDKALEYKNNIMEVAHPNSVVLAPSYDKLNGLLENNNERQRIMLNIVTKMPNGHLTAKKYAESDLVHSLVRVANEMDNKDIDSLRVLADTCAAQLTKNASVVDTITNLFSDKAKDAVDIGGGAVGGAAIGGIIGGLVGIFGGPVGIAGGAWTGAQIGGLLGGLASSISKTSPQAKNVAINADLARKELADLMATMPQDESLKSLDNELIVLSATAKKYAAVVSQMRASVTSEADKKATEEIATQYLTELAKAKKLTALFMASAKSGAFIKDENQYWAKIKAPFAAVFGDDVHDEEGALGTLEKVIEAAIIDVQKLQSEAASIKAQIDAKQNAAPPVVNQPPATPPVPAAAPKEDKSLMDEFLGKK